MSALEPDSEAGGMTDAEITVASPPTPGQAARERLASAVHDLFDGNCPDDPLCPGCGRREGELMDLADDYAAAAAPGVEDDTRLRAQNDRLRGQLQAARALAEDAAVAGIIDSRALLDQLEAS